MINKKVRKLIRDPNLFFSDMLLKHRSNLLRFKPKKQHGHYQYTVVSAVYNVGRYLDDYFKSLVNQRLDFKNHIHLVLVDDGSTDNSAEIIKRWQKKYPENITYLWKKNGGQASARNLGLQYVKTEWVTFVDPDDFLDAEYFSSIDCFTWNHRNKNIKFICNSLVFYFEKDKSFKNTHPLNYRFKKGNVVLSIQNIGKNIQLSASTALFKAQDVIERGITFKDIKPSFEDAHFVIQYMSGLDNNSSITFIPDAKYYYRKRDDGTSTLDTAWQKKGLFSEVLEYGCLDAINMYLNEGRTLPTFVQRAILYHLIWYIKRIVNNPEQISFLTLEEKVKFRELLLQIFRHIDKQVIESFELAGCWFYHKVGMLGLFKNTLPEFQIIYVDSFDSKKNLVCLYYFSPNTTLESISVDGVDVLPAYIKTRHHDFIGDTFVLERRLWVPLPANGILKVRIGNLNTRIALAGRQYRDEIGCKLLIDTLQTPTKGTFTNSWLFMDRDVQADDNAEHLYRYVRDHHPEQDIYFVLRRESHDWQRLQQDSFNLVEFGSTQHENILHSCAKLLSSHADKYVTNYLGPKMLQGRHFIFLQHGVTKDDLSAWLNQKEQINCFVTASSDECTSICGDESRYKYGKKEVCLTGFPRHDSLLSMQGMTENILIIMPTWRKNILGELSEGGNTRELNPEFMETEYAKHWVSLLQSEILKKLVQQYNYKILFFPHANIQPYLPMMTVPEYIETVSHQHGSMQPLFARAKLMITDYSSVAFEMAIQGKGVIYYQFDEDVFFNGSHSYSKGYFEYRRDGFGPVVLDEATLLAELETMLVAGGDLPTEYKARIESTFPFRDGNNCKRTYEAIVALDQPMPEGFVDQDILLAYAEQATTFGDWPLAEDRWCKAAALGDESLLAISRLRLSQALREQGKLGEAMAHLECIEFAPKYYEEYIRQLALLAMAREEWWTAATHWQALSALTITEQLAHFRTLAEQGLHEQIALLIAQWPEKDEEASIALPVAQVWLAVAQQEYLEASELLNDVITDLNAEQLRNWQPQLLLSRCYRELGDFEAAHQQLVTFEQHSRNVTACRVEIARLAHARADAAKVLSQLDQAYPQVLDIPVALKPIYLKAKAKKTPRDVIALARQFAEAHPETLDLISMQGTFAQQAGKWDEAEACFRQIALGDEAPLYRLAHAHALRMQGRIPEALDIILLADTPRPASYEELHLAAEVAQLANRWDLAAEYWTALLSRFGDKLTENHTNQWRTAVLMQQLTRKDLQPLEIN